MKTILEIKKVNFDLLNSVEYAHFLKGTLDLVRNSQLTHLNLEQEVYDALLKSHEDLTEATRQVRFSSETQKINNLDKQRCDYVVFLLSSFRFEQKNPIESRQEAAKVLHKLLKRYSGVQLLPAGQKTQTIEGFLVDIKKPELNGYLETLGVQHAVTSLTEANKEYQKLVSGRAESQLTNTLINSRKVRKEATKLYRYLVRCVEGQHIVTQSAESANFINLLNKLITDTMNANKHRLAQISNTKKGNVGEESINSPSEK